MTATPSESENPIHVERAGTCAAVPWVFWKALQIVLALGVCTAFLVGAILLVLAISVIAEGKLFPFALAFSGGFICLLVAWFLGKGVRSARKTANDLAIAEYTEAIRLDQGTPISHHNRGLACHRKGDYAR